MPAPGGLAAVFQRFGAAYRATHPLSASQATVWRAILACRTHALGGHVERCTQCGRQRHVYHSCRNRHCPQCQTRAKEAWLAARRRELLPVPYFHLVFTLPHALNGLIAQHPRALYEMLLAAVAATLSEFAANPRWLGGIPAYTLVLHTWKQDLGRHVHVHALVAGGALTATGGWVGTKSGFLFPVQALSRVFRGKFVAMLERVRREDGGHPEALVTGLAWQELRRALYAHDWVVYAKQPLGGPAQVLEYLGRYTHRVAISNERLVHLDASGVVFRVRAHAGSKKRLLHLPGSEFIRRFLLHVLPRGFKRIRHYGLLGPAHKATQLAKARAALNAPTPAPAVIESVASFLQRVGALPGLRIRPLRVGRADSADTTRISTRTAMSRPPFRCHSLSINGALTRQGRVCADAINTWPLRFIGHAFHHPETLFSPISLDLRVPRSVDDYAFGLTTRPAFLQSP